MRKLIHFAVAKIFIKNNKLKQELDSIFNRQKQQHINILSFTAKA